MGLRLASQSAFLITLAFVWLVCLLWHGSNLNRVLFSQLYDHGGKLSHVADLISGLGSPQFLYVVLAVGAVVLLWLRRTREALILITLVLSCRVLRLVQEMTFVLPRPNVSVRHVEAFSPYAFPSGHAANSMATYLSLALIIATRSRWRDFAVALALAMTFAVGMSRISVGAHWPSDVVAGWSFGSFWTVGILWLTTELTQNEDQVVKVT